MTLNFARRPFRDYRPVYLVAGGTLLIGAILFGINASLYGQFRRDVADTREEIAWLEQRQARATAAADEARNALRAYETSELSMESRGLLRLVEERQFSWIALLSRLERVLPAEVRLTRLQPSFKKAGESEIDIALVGRGPESVVRTLAALSRSPYFSAIELKSEIRSESKQGVPEGYAFTVTTAYEAKGAR
ncbi:MAG TPA: PilN domain-containing protein [Thermoanaerobaculia bacterium]|jgi:Tfp pilus assembly protein PilN